MNDQNDPQLELTIAILCLNEEMSITQCVSEALGFLERNAISGEVLVVDNNSDDRSAALAAEAGARVIVETRRGYGNATIAGIESAKGRWTIIGDGDGEHDLDALEPFWERLQEGYDFVFGNRFSQKSDYPGSFLRRYVGNYLLSSIGKLLTRSPVGDFLCGLKGVDTAYARALMLKSPGMEMSSEIVTKAVLADARITEIPIIQRQAIDADRSSHVRIWRDGWYHLRLLIVMSPQWLFLYPSFVLFAVGILSMIVPIAYPPQEGGWFGTYTMIFGAAFVVSGGQVFFFFILSSVFYDSIGISQTYPGTLMQREGVPESIFACASIMGLLGAAGCVWSLFVWSQTGDTAIESRMRIAIPSVTLLILSLQMIFSISFMTILTLQSNREIRNRDSTLAVVPPPPPPPPRTRV